MNYYSTVTSKGTITLPASIRKKLSITEGKKVEISLHGHTISVTPQGGWDEFFVATEKIAEKANIDIKQNGIKPLLTSEDIEAAASKGRANGY